MAQISGVYSGDTIENVLAAPMDWGKLEALAYDVLVADDFPALRKIGGVGDDGMDAVEEAFYDAERKVTTVIQVTSAQGQKAKVSDTLTKLKKNGIETKKLVFLTRHPVTAGKRAEMIDSADEQGVTLDVRDQTYLVTQLSKNRQIFARYFGDAGTQLSALLDAPDPLHAASDRLQHALLATLGAFVLHERAHLARGTLFEKTVLAALAASPKGGGRARTRYLLTCENCYPKKTSVASSLTLQSSGSQEQVSAPTRAIASCAARQCCLGVLPQHVGPTTASRNCMITFCPNAENPEG